MKHRWIAGVAAVGMALATAAYSAPAQTRNSNTAASDQDKSFIKDTAQDTNFEIRTGQLALQKSSSADIKQYATMIIRDHKQLQTQITSATTAAKADPVSAGSMSLGQDASYAKLKLLSGKSFEESYIKELIQGNQGSVDAAKSEASSSSVPAVKRLAERRVSMDSKHTAAAEKLAQAHGVSK